jgi:hypothetical protein
MKPAGRTASGPSTGATRALQECGCLTHGGHDPAGGFQIDFSVVECGVRFGVSEDSAGGFQAKEFGQFGGGVVPQLVW